MPGVLPDLSESNIQNHLETIVALRENSRLDNIDKEIRDNVNNRTDNIENSVDRFLNI